MSDSNKNFLYAVLKMDNDSQFLISGGMDFQIQEPLNCTDFSPDLEREINLAGLFPLQLLRL